MPQRRNYHKFPHGQTCEQCPSKRWYSEDGRRYCDRGHEIEGFVERGFEDENAFKQTGHVARKEKEAREKAPRMLSGNASRELYLQCLQLVLRKQLFWLVRERALPSELETIVRDLWGLRTRNIAGLRTVGEARRREEQDDDESAGLGGVSGAESDAGSGVRLYSSDGSGADTDTARSDTSGKTRRSGRTRSWSQGIGSKRGLPRLIDTLGLCYLGCLLMRLPIRVGDLFGWGKSNQIPYLDAIYELPLEMRARLPAAYQKALSARHAPFVGGELHEAVLTLATSFHTNYQLEFPPLNRPLILLRYTKELALPAEIYAFVQGMVDFLNADFTFPLERRRVKMVDHPDVFLVACTVLTTKLLCPFDGGKRAVGIDHESSNGTPVPLLQIDWAAWKDEFSETTKDTLTRRDVEKLTPEEAWTMSETKVQDYLDWYQQVKVDTEAPNTLARFAAMFPLDELSQEPSVEDPEEYTIEERLMRLQKRLNLLPEVADSQESGQADVPKRLGVGHHAHRTAEDLPETARAFYEKAADISGISIHDLVKCVYILECRLDMWIRRMKKDARAEDSS